MSRTVHIVKLYEEHSELFKFIMENQQINLLHSKKNCKYFSTFIDRFNEIQNSKIGSHYHKGLSMPRLKIIVALMAQKQGVKFVHERFSSRLKFVINLKKTPLRFQQKFIPLLVNGIWLLGNAIEDSLSEDPQINCGNPFGFEKGDIGFWWASLVVVDWLKYRKSHFMDKQRAHLGCLEFYSDSSLSRKYKYNQNSGNSSLSKTPAEFLEGIDLKNFHDAIDKLYYTSFIELFQQSQEREKRNDIDDAFMSLMKDAKCHFQTSPLLASIQEDPPVTE